MTDRTSEDFLDFTIDDLLAELDRRSVTMVASLEVEGEGDSEDPDYDNRVRFYHSGDPFARVGHADLLMTHIRRQTRSMLEFMD